MASKNVKSGITGFQGLIGASILIVALAFAYYLIIYIPAQARVKQEQDVLRQQGLQNCLSIATNGYNSKWVNTCQLKGENDNCLLDIKVSQGFDTALKNDQDSCYKRYPAQ